MPGIFNPFSEPKPDPPSFEDLVNDPEPDRTVKTVRLDGDSHVLVLSHCLLEDVPERLYALLHDVQRLSPAVKGEMQRRGISVSDTPEEDAVNLKTSKGYVCVRGVAPGEKESKVFQRIAQAVHGLPVRTTLARHNARVVVRG